jgi:DNA-binding MarR family transcriptional regulator
MALYQKEILKLVDILLHKLFIYENNSLLVGKTNVDLMSIILLKLISKKQSENQGYYIKEFGFSNSDFQSVLRKLLKLDLVKKSTDSKDKRNTIICLTAKGEKELKELEKGEESLLGKLLDDFTVNEEKVILKFLSKVNQLTVGKHEG